MAHVQRLSIQGVRSFDPDNNEEIIFFPLTIILGPNGAGKTSIIESLKYATTGVMPPNSNNGKTFIHDIQYANKPIIHGQVRLKFTDIEKKSTVITRSIQASIKQQKNKKPNITFRQINSVIKREGSSIDQKCADINSELIELIGVSKAVLTNVIFCHQEETNWPLSDGKVLKEKFDDIFGSIAYVKTLEKIKKSRDEEVKQLHLFEKDVKYAQHLKKEADNKKRILAEESAKLDSEKDAVKKIEIQAKEVNKKLDDLVEKESNIQELLGEISQYEALITAKQESANELKKTCNKATMSLSYDEVVAKLDNFDANVLTAKCQKKELEQKLKDVDSEYFSLMKEKQKFSTEIAKIEEIEKLLKNYQSKRDNLILNIDSPTSDIDSIVKKIKNNEELSLKDGELIENHFKCAISNAESTLESEKSKLVQKETEKKNHLDLLKRNKSNISHEKEIWHKQRIDIQAELDELNNSSQSKNSSESYMKILSEKISLYRKQMARFDDFNEAKFRVDIERLENEKKVLKDEIEKLDQQLVSANEYNEERVKYNHLVEQQEERSSQIDEIKMKHLELFVRLGADEGDFHEKLSEEIDNLSSTLDEVNQSISELEKEYYTVETKLESKEELLSQKEKSIENLKCKLHGICEIEDFDNVLARTEESLKKLRKEKSRLENMAPVISKQIEVIESNSTCPVCEHDLAVNWISKKTNSIINKSDLIHQLEKSKVDNPNELYEVNQKISEKEKLFNKLATLTSFIESNRDTSELSSLKQDISNFGKQIEQTKLLLDKERKKADSSRKELEDLQRCLLDASEYDKSSKELEEISRKIDQIDSSKWESSVDINLLKCDLNQKRVSFKTCDRKLSDMQKEMIKMSEEKFKTQSLLQTAEKNQADYEKQQQDRLAVGSKKKELTSKLDDLDSKISNLERRAGDFEPDILKAEKELSVLKEQISKLDKINQQKIYQYQDSLKSIARIFGEIQKYSDELELIKTKTSKDYIDELEQKLTNFESNKRNLSSELDTVKEEIVSSELQKKELMNYQRFLDLKKSIVELEEKLEEVKKRMGYSDYAAIKRTLINTERESQKLETQKQNCLSRVMDITDRISNIKSELAQDEYANAENTYKESVINKTLSELICEDLNSYYKALDVTITSFHRSKMEEINKLIKNFWNIAYQGNDIDYIQIVSEEEERSAADRRRSYNYRVVMYRKNKEMDMKGRCSAGQKVLASLIIRLALAVIFCRKFPVLALDEPTTNLDKSNIHSFAKAVINLIKSNQATLNFQIIIITHDEEFLQCLDSDTGEYYYRVSKNKHGYSSIEKKSIFEDTNIFVDNNQAAEEEEQDDDEFSFEVAPKKARLSKTSV